MVRLKETVSETIKHSLEFQFQYGSIKSFQFRDNFAPYYLFQFQYGSIKSCRLTHKYNFCNIISIPIWFD